mmetsp:Transcript_25187/g.48170  ORF Transcript_25187/g.48170 Transcript_25187/m.48170 type:complete len:209 (-) Transcript_25187:36-662(-)
MNDRLTAPLINDESISVSVNTDKLDGGGGGGNNRNKRNTRLGRSPCCDSKRGTIFVNRSNIFLNAFAIFAFTFGRDYFSSEENAVGLDKETLDHIEDTYLTTMILCGVHICINMLVIYGTSIYNIYIVGVGMVYGVVHVIFTLAIDAELARGEPNREERKYYYFYYVFPIVWMVVNLYWQLLFIWEVKRGIMRKETYLREKYSCFCHV